MSENARIAEVDVLRGLLAITVVLGHAIQQYEMAIGEPWLAIKDLIYSFHMPAFVFASGFCVYRMPDQSNENAGMGILWGRVRRLIIPYLSWGCVYFILRLLAGDYARIPYDYDHAVFFLLGYNPDGAMWFVWALFAATVFLLPLRKVSPERLLLPIFLLIAVVHYSRLGSVSHWRALCAVPTYMFFILLGGLSRKWLEDSRASGFPRRIQIGCASCFAVSYVLHIGRFSRIFPWDCLTSISATLLLCSLAFEISRGWRLARSLLVLLGVEAMSIYVLGEPIKVMCRIAFAKAGIPLVVAFPVMLACMFVLPITLARIIRRSVVLRQLLLGEFKTR